MLLDPVQLFPAEAYSIKRMDAAFVFDRFEETLAIANGISSAKTLEAVRHLKALARLVQRGS
jgi:hypothetical protein